LFNIILHCVVQLLNRALLRLLMRLYGQSFFLDLRLKDFPVLPDLVEVVLERLGNPEDLLDGLIVAVNLGLEVG
jgi:hypothetical protein